MHTSWFVNEFNASVWYMGGSINPHITTHIDSLSISLLPLLTLLEYNVGVPMCVWVGGCDGGMKVQ